VKLLDTTVAVDHLRGAAPAVELLHRLVEDDEDVAASEVVRFELLAGVRDDELEALHLVTRVDVGQGQARYEPARADHHHHHLVCDVCGTVIPFHDAALERAIVALSRDVDFDVTDHEIVLHGVCASCRASA